MIYQTHWRNRGQSETGLCFFTLPSSRLLVLESTFPHLNKRSTGEGLVDSPRSPKPKVTVDTIHLLPFGGWCRIPLDLLLWCTLYQATPPCCISYHCNAFQGIRSGCFRLAPTLLDVLNLLLAFPAQTCNPPELLRQLIPLNG